MNRKSSLPNNAPINAIVSDVEREIVIGGGQKNYPAPTKFYKSSRGKKAGVRRSRGQAYYDGLAREQRARLLRGMADANCWMITLKGDRIHHSFLRSEDWRIVWIRIRQKWPEAQAFTVYEYKKNVLMHLHVVVKHTPGISTDWVRHIIHLRHDDREVKIKVQDVYFKPGVARYLTKQLSNRRVMNGWPKNFRPTTATHGWSPGWLTRREMFARRHTLRTDR